MLLFVAVCFILLYWPVIVSFSASVKTGISIQLVAIATFCFATRNTFVLRVFVQFILNVTPATLLNFGGTAQKEIRFSYMCWDICLVFLSSCFKSWSRKVSTDFHPHDAAVCFEMLCYLYWYCFG